MSRFDPDDLKRRIINPADRLTALRILSGRAPLGDVNKPGTNPALLRYFQDPKSQAFIQKRPLAGGLDRVANQAAVDARVPAAQAAIKGKRGVPRSRPGETREQMEARLVRSGITKDQANLDSFSRFRLNEQREQRLAGRQQRLTDLDARRKAAGLPTSTEREAASREAQQRIIERRQGPDFLAGVNEKRIAQGRKPLGKVVQGRGDSGPVEVISVDEVTVANGFASGSFVREPDGQIFRFNNIGGVPSFTPMTTDPVTGRVVTDLDQIDFDEFRKEIDQFEREAWRDIIRQRAQAGGDPTFARRIREVNNERGGVSAVPGTRKVDDERRADGQEQLDEKEARIFFDYQKAIGLSLSDALQQQSEAEIKQQDAQVKAAEKERAAQETKAKTEEASLESEINAARQIVIDRKKAAAETGEPVAPPTDDEIIKEAERQRELKERLRNIEQEQASEQTRQQITSIMNQAPLETGSFTGITIEQEQERQADLETLKPPQDGAVIDRGTGLRILAHVERFHPQLTDDEDLANMARRITAELKWVR